MNQNTKPLTVLITILLTSFLLMGMSSSEKTTEAAVGNAIRPTPIPTAVPSNPGGWIVLQAEETAVTDNLWTRIEWQDPNIGEWQEVAGWQGEFDGNNRVMWYVAPENFGERPFRWRVYSDQSQSTLIATSESFDLPSGRWHEVVVEIEW